MEKMLAKRVCIVTGGGRGIGRATAKLFAQEGGHVVVAEIDEAPAAETIAETRKDGGAAVAAVGDITEEGVPEQIVQTAVDAFGPNIDVVANVAGYTWDGFIHKMTDKQVAGGWY